MRPGGDDTVEMPSLGNEVSEGIRIRVLQVEQEETERLSPGDMVERAIEESGDNEKYVYYDGGAAFMNVSSDGPEDLSLFTDGVQEVMRSMKRSIEAKVKRA